MNLTLKFADKLGMLFEGKDSIGIKDIDGIIQ